MLKLTSVIGIFSERQLGNNRRYLAIRFKPTDIPEFAGRVRVGCAYDTNEAAHWGLE